VSTKAGDLELAIPKLRRGSFFPSVLERRRRSVEFLRTNERRLTALRLTIFVYVTAVSRGAW
jgi:transposase-like protein